MPRFAANLSMMFTEWPFLDRFEQAATAGFDAVEYHFPYEFAASDIASRLKANGLVQALFNLPPGDWKAGERGLASLFGRDTEFRQGLEKALHYAEATGTKRLHLMAGLSPATDEESRARYMKAVDCAARHMAGSGIDILLEPINRRNEPAYFLNDFAMAAEIVSNCGHSNVRLQFDIYHRQILHGDVLVGLREFMPLIGHVQVASVPGRNEPGTGELNDFMIFDELDRLRYAGFVGCEYWPSADTLGGLGWLEEYRGKQPPVG